MTTTPETPAPNDCCGLDPTDCTCAEGLDEAIGRPKAAPTEVPLRDAIALIEATAAATRELATGAIDLADRYDAVATLLKSPSLHPRDLAPASSRVLLGLLTVGKLSDNAGNLAEEAGYALLAAQEELQR